MTPTQSRIVVAVLVVIAILTLTLLAARYRWLLAPGRDDERLHTFRASAGQDSRAMRIRHQGDVYIVVFGDQPFPNENPAGYLFSADGRLLDWSPEATPETGLDPLWEYWDAAVWESRAGRDRKVADFVRELSSSD
jgi:hypothetical protein